MRWPVGSLAVLALVAVAGCEVLSSDAENYAREQRAERARRLAGMKAATHEIPRGADVAGDALARLVSGRTHVFTYGTSPGGRAERYVEWTYFRPDGHFVYRNTQWAVAPDGRDGDHWRVDGERLCVLNQAMSSDEHCYRLAVQAEGRVQYYVAAPGDETDGLLTKVTDAVTEGPPNP
jgi:hypothetical protein